MATALAVVLALGLAGCTITLGPDASTSDRNDTVTVVSVVDGDTLDVRFSNGSTDRVRLLGVDTPEVHVAVEPTEYEGVPDTEAGRTCLRAAGENASSVVRSRLSGETVTLVFDPAADTRGAYGRLLAYVVHEGQNINAALVSDGHARLYDSEFGQRERFASAEQAAQAAGRGLWSCRTPP